MATPDPPPLYILDTNCWIDATRRTPAGGAVIRLLRLAAGGELRMALSRHSLHELEVGNQTHDDGALELAQKYPIIPYYPIGSFKELLGTLDDLAGSFDDIRRHEDLQRNLETLANRGTDLRDRGAVIDALRAGAAGFVTSDHQLSGEGPAQRIHEALGLSVVAPRVLASQLGDLTEPLSFSPCP